MDTTRPTVLSLCAGVGMFEIGLGLAWEHCFGVRPRVAAVCEWEAYPEAVQVARMEDESLEPAPIFADDLANFPADLFSGLVDIITAGFPCQPWSCSGRQKGKKDERWIWPAIADIIRRVGPEWVALENVPGLISGGGLDSVLRSLAEMGFDAEWGCLSAESVGASHKRERVFIMAYASGGQQRLDVDRERDTQEQPDAGAEVESLADASLVRLQGGGHEHAGKRIPGQEGRELFAPGPADHRWPDIISETPWLAPAVEPGFRQLASGESVVVDASRMDQLRCCGNQVVALCTAIAVAELVRRLTVEDAA